MNLSKYACICVLLALNGCAETSWQRPGTDPAVAASDYKLCRDQASLSARRLMSVDPQNMPRIITSPGGERTVVMPAFPAVRDPLMERDFLSRCLREKGYTLVEIR